MSEQASLLDLIGNDPRHDDEYQWFLDCARDVALAAREFGIVSPNWMRRLFSNEHGMTIEPRRYSSFWRRAVKDGHLQRLDRWEINEDYHGRNSGKKQDLYRWVGAW